MWVIGLPLGMGCQSLSEGVLVVQKKRSVRFIVFVVPLVFNWFPARICGSVVQEV